ncbi:F-box/kelch-repeat protein At5g42350-like [Wolffia australiana]
MAIGRTRRSLRDLLLDKEDAEDDGFGASARRRTSKRGQFRWPSLCRLGKGAACRVGACEDCIVVGECQKPRGRASETGRSKDSEEIVPARQLPDDLLELCLLRLPFRSLHSARLVCKKWLQVTTSQPFLRRRSGDFARSSWLFLFCLNGGQGELHAFDTCLRQWRAVRADLLVGRFLYSVAAAGGEIYAVGGRSSGARTRRGVVVFSPLAGRWRRAPPMRIPRAEPVLCVLETAEARFLLIAAGGRGGEGEPLDSAEIYDPAAEEWRLIGDSPVGAACSAAALGGAFYVCSRTGRLGRYDPGLGLWSRVEASPAPPRLPSYAPAIVACRGRLFMVCVSWDRTEMARRRLWELDQGRMAWTQFASHPDAPTDPGAVFVSDRTTIYGLERFAVFGRAVQFLTACGVGPGPAVWTRVSTRGSARSRESMAVLRL